MMQGEENMDTATFLYIQELEAILACDQSDGYMKKWAQERLDYIREKTGLIQLPFEMPEQERTPVLVG